MFYPFLGKQVKIKQNLSKKTQYFAIENSDLVISREREFSRAGEIMNKGRYPKSNAPREELNTKET